MGIWKTSQWCFHVFLFTKNMWNTPLSFYIPALSLNRHFVFSHYLTQSTFFLLTYFFKKIIIFSSVWILSIKIIKLKFYKIQKKKRNQFKPIDFGSVKLFHIKNRNLTDPFGSVRFNFDSVIFILKTKNYIVFWCFLDFLMGLVSVWFGFFYFFGLVWFGFLIIFFIFSRFNWFFGFFFLTPTFSIFPFCA